MIEKIKTVTYEIRSHGYKTVLSKKGIIEGEFCVFKAGDNDIDRAVIKKVIWHLEDVLKCMNTIRKEEVEKKVQGKIYKTINELREAGILSKKKGE